MTRYSLNLPTQLKLEAETLAQNQGVSLNQFILWAVSEKVGKLSHEFSDPRFPQVVYGKGTDGRPVPKLRGKGLRVKTIVLAHTDAGQSVEEIAADYQISVTAVQNALNFYRAHQAEIDQDIARDETLALNPALFEKANSQPAAISVHKSTAV